MPSQDETRRANVLREEMLSQFRVFGESLSIIRDEVTGIKPRLDRVEEKVTILESAVRTNGRDIFDLKTAVSLQAQAIQTQAETIQANTNAIYAMQSEFKVMNRRVEVIETKMAS